MSCHVIGSPCGHYTPSPGRCVCLCWNRSCHHRQCHHTLTCLSTQSADDMEIVDLEPEKAGDKLADEEGTKYPFRWFKLCHPGGPGCKVHKDFRQPGYDFEKNYQAEIQMTI